MLLIMVSTTGCCLWPCALAEHQIDLSSPEQTLESLRMAFACDLPELEYRCLATDLKDAIGGFSVYKSARDDFRENNGLVLFMTKMGDLEGRVEVAYAADGNRATARIDTPGGIQEVVLTNEPEYRLFHPDGSVTWDFADSVVAQPGPPGRVLVMIQDQDLVGEPRKPIQRIELRPRWVIATLPDLGPALNEATTQSQVDP